MDSLKFEPGAEVILQSGGPFMTVKRSDKGQVICVWFAGDELKRSAFPEATLKTRVTHAAVMIAKRSAMSDSLDGW